VNAIIIRTAILAGGAAAVSRLVAAPVDAAEGLLALSVPLSLAKLLFVPVTVAAYLSLGATDDGYPSLIRFLVPARLRVLEIHPKPSAGPR